MAHHGLQVPFEPAQPTAAYASRAMWNSASGGPESIVTSCSRQNCALAKPASRQAATATINLEARMPLMCHRPAARKIGTCFLFRRCDRQAGPRRRKRQHVPIFGSELLRDADARPREAAGAPARVELLRLMADRVAHAQAALEHRRDAEPGLEQHVVEVAERELDVALAELPFEEGVVEPQPLRGPWTGGWPAYSDDPGGDSHHASRVRPHRTAISELISVT